MNAPKPITEEHLAVLRDMIVNPLSHDDFLIALNELCQSLFISNPDKKYVVLEVHERRVDGTFDVEPPNGERYILVCDWKDKLKTETIIFPSDKWWAELPEVQNG